MLPRRGVIVAGLGHRGSGASQAMELVAQEELGLARRYLPVLDTVVTLSPPSVSSARSPA